MRWKYGNCGNEGCFKGFQGSEVERIERIKKEEEERRGNEAEALPNRDRDHSLRCFLVLCSSCDPRLVFIFED